MPLKKYGGQLTWKKKISPRFKTMAHDTSRIAHKFLSCGSKNLPEKGMPGYLRAAL